MAKRKSTAVHGNPGSSVQIRGWPTQAAQGDAPRGGHFPQGLLKERHLSYMKNGIVQIPARLFQAIYPPKYCLVR